MRPTEGVCPCGVTFAVKAGRGRPREYCSGSCGAAAWRAANLEKCRARDAAWRAANPEKARAYAAVWQAANPEKAHAHGRKHRTGWSAEVFDAAWTTQSGLCGLCGEPMTRGGKQAKSVVADHWEPDGVKTPRSLLHMTCNSDLGHIEKLFQEHTFRGRPLSLYLAYLERHEALK